MTMTSGMPRDCPMLVMMGMRIKEATVWEMKVATEPEKNRMKTKANQGLDNGSAVSNNIYKVIKNKRFAAAAHKAYRR